MAVSLILTTPGNLRVAKSDVRNSRDTACEAAGSGTVREVRGLDQDTNRVEVVMRSKEAALPVLVAGLFTV